MTNFVSIEEKILKYWKDNGLFQKSVDKNSEEEFIFYDGPPFANGLPHYGHLLTGFTKDCIARYQTISGKKVQRRFGWDCHGLPAEMHSEKELNIQGRLAIEEYGIDKFNQVCKNSVMKYEKEWEYYVDRQARWVDFENNYKTMNKDYMESVLWAFKTLHEKGLIYQDYKVMYYSWKCQTTLSNFEARMDNAYREKESKAVTTKFKLKTIPKKFQDAMPNIKNFYLLAWTTMPWTYASNLLLAINENNSYVAYRKGEDAYIFAKELQDKMIQIIDQIIP